MLDPWPLLNHILVEVRMDSGGYPGQTLVQAGMPRAGCSGPCLLMQEMDRVIQSHHVCWWQPPAHNLFGSSVTYGCCILFFFKPEERAMRMVASLLDPNHPLSMFMWVRHPPFVHNCRNWRFKVNLNNLYSFSVKREYLSSLEGILSSSTKEEFEKELISKRRFCVMMF